MRIKIIKSSTEWQHEADVNTFIEAVEVVKMETMTHNNCLVTVITFEN